MVDLWAGRDLKRYMVSTTPGSGAPSSGLYSRELPHLQKTSPSKGSFAWLGIRLGHDGLGGRRNETQALWCLDSHIPLSFPIRKRISPKAQVAPITRVGLEEILPPCGRFPKQQLENWCLGALRKQKALEAVNDTCVLGLVIENDLKQGGISGTSFQGVNFTQCCVLF